MERMNFVLILNSRISTYGEAKIYSDLFRKSFDLTLFEKKSGKVMTWTFFIFRRKSAENGQSQIDFNQNLV